MDFVNADEFETRTFRTKVGENVYSILVIDDAEKWQKAIDIKAEYGMKVSDDHEMTFDLSGISLAQWEEVEEQHVIPEERQNATDEAKAEIKQAGDKAELAKKVKFFEIATGSKIPGETFEDKNIFLAERCVGHLEALYEYVTTSLVNLADGYLIREYLQATIEDDSKKTSVKFTGFESWKKASETRITFLMNRPFDRYIIEFPLKGISEIQKREIEEQTPQPKPPMLPARTKSGRGFDPNNLEPNFNDPSWRNASRASMQKKTALLFDACLPFEIPGDNLKEKYDWIATHLVGDVIRIKNFIENNVLSSAGSIDFFGGSSFQ